MYFLGKYGENKRESKELKKSKVHVFRKRENANKAKGQRHSNFPLTPITAIVSLRILFSALTILISNKIFDLSSNPSKRIE